MKLLCVALAVALGAAAQSPRIFYSKKFPENYQQSFNYSTDENARILVDWFERIVESERLLIGLETAVRFDRIGVNQAVLDLAVTYERKRLVAPEQFLPMLDRIAKNDTFVHIARERAASLADSFRAPKPKSE